MPLTTDDEIRDLLQSVRTVALVGASDRPERASFGVMETLLKHGYRVFPVNPTIAGGHVHGEFVYSNLLEIREPIDLVDIFRRADALDPIIDDAIAADAKAIWMQLGVINEDAAARAEAAGMKVVMNRCPRIEIGRLRLSPVA